MRIYDFLRRKRKSKAYTRYEKALFTRMLRTMDNVEFLHEYKTYNLAHLDEMFYQALAAGQNSGPTCVDFLRTEVKKHIATYGEQITDINGAWEKHVLARLQAIAAELSVLSTQIRKHYKEAP